MWDFHFAPSILMIYEYAKSVVAEVKTTLNTSRFVLFYLSALPACTGARQDNVNSHKVTSST